MHVLLLQGNGESMQPLPFSDNHSRWVYLHSCDVDLCTLWIDTSLHHSNAHTHAHPCLSTKHPF